MIMRTPELCTMFCTLYMPTHIPPDSGNMHAENLRLCDAYFGPWSAFFTKMENMMQKKTSDLCLRKADSCFEPSIIRIKLKCYRLWRQRRRRRRPIFMVLVSMMYVHLFLKEFQCRTDSLVKCFLFRVQMLGTIS